MVAHANAAREEPKAEPQKEAAKQEPVQTPEQWIGQFPPVTQNWLNTHKDYVTDHKLHRKLLRFADEFMDDNGTNKLHTSEFISALNEKFFPKKAETPKVEEGSDEVEVEEEAPKRKVAAPAAPVSRTSANSPAKQTLQGKVRLSAQEQTAAYGMFPKLEPRAALHKYAQFVQRLAQDGISRDLPQQH